MIDVKPLLDPGFWFALQPDLLSPAFEKGFFILFGLMIIFGAIIRIVAKQKKYDRYIAQTFNKIGVMLLSMGLIGLSWFFFTFEGIYIVGARFWFILWLIGLVAWIWSIVKFVKKDIPELKAEREARADANQYLPKKKKKK